MLIPRSVFPVSKVAAKESTRYAFNGVQIQRKGEQCRASATDGRRALVMTWTPAKSADYPPVFDSPDAPVADFQAVIPTESFDKLGKGIIRRSSNVQPILDNAALHEPTANGTVKLAASRLDEVTRIDAVSIEGTFPPIDDVIPTLDIIERAKFDSEHPALENRGVKCHINAKMLREMLQVVESMRAEDERPTVTITIPVATNRPIRLDARNDSGVELVGILMPVNPEA